MERVEREKNRRKAYQSAQQVERAALTTSKNKESRSMITGSPFSFGEDEDDAWLERDINADLDVLEGITSRLKGIALATQVEVDAQIDKIETIDTKVSPTP
jgi:osmotically-inducible protein OsmY